MMKFLFGVIAPVFALIQLPGTSDAQLTAAELTAFLDGSIPRLLPVESCTLLGKVTDYETGHDDFSWTCAFDVDNNRQLLILPIEGIDMPKDAYDNDDKKILSGQHTLFAAGMQIVNGAAGPQLEFPIGAKPIIQNGQKSGTNRKLTDTVGDKDFLVVRVIGADSATTNSVAVLSDSVFGTNGDQVNIASQFAACSYNKLNVLPGTQPAGALLSVSDGAVEVTISNTITNVNSYTLVNAVINELVAQGFSLPGDYDNIMICLPPGTAGSWIAYAYLDHWLSVYNDEWCKSVSSQMHEIGHNFNLGHSGQGGNQYDDRSGMMGYSYWQSDAPLMCFNGPKSWQLGWYDDRHTTVEPLSLCWTGNLVGLVDYINSMGETVILKINTSTNTDYYVNFNRQAGINSGTNEGGDQVMITTQGGEGGSYSPSTLQETLNSGESYSISNFDGSGQTVTITVDSISTPTTYTVATVTVVLLGENCFSPTQTPTIVPTSGPTPSPTSGPTPTPTSVPTTIPTSVPTFEPTTSIPTSGPTAMPSSGPTSTPPSGPTLIPTSGPTSNPTQNPTPGATTTPMPTSSTDSPTQSPTIEPTSGPTPSPTLGLTPPTSGPTVITTLSPTAGPTTSIPTSGPTAMPSSRPTSTSPSAPTLIPTSGPTSNPTHNPTSGPTTTPMPTSSTDSPTQSPTIEPTSGPTPSPTLGLTPPTSGPTVITTLSPTSGPSSNLTTNPTATPMTQNPTTMPTSGPTVITTLSPTSGPSSNLTNNPTATPMTQNPTTMPTSEPSSTPTSVSTSSPTVAPTSTPTSEPTSLPTFSPTSGPTSITSPPTIPTLEPTSGPETCTDVEGKVRYYDTIKSKKCIWFNRYSCRNQLVSGGLVFQVCQDTCSQFLQVTNHPDWIDCIDKPTQTPTAVPTSNSTECVDLETIVRYVHWNGKIRKRKCSKMKKHLCKRPLQKKGLVFEVCQATCSQYDIITNHDDWIKCVPPSTCEDSKEIVGVVNAKGQNVYKYCKHFNKRLCLMPLITGGFGFEVCQHKCSQFSAITNRPDSTNCLNDY